MRWIDVKQSLLYGQPDISPDRLQPQTVKAAVHEIARLVSIGWIDQPTDAMVSRIQQACQVSHCSDEWDDLQNRLHPVLETRNRKPGRSRARRSA